MKRVSFLLVFKDVIIFVNVKRGARFLGVAAESRIALALCAVVMRILSLQAAHQFPMPIQLGIRELLMKFLQKLSKGRFLLRRSRILGRLAVPGTSTDVDHTDAISVVSVLSAMRPHPIDRPAVVDGAVEVNHFVISDAVGPVVLGPVDVVNLLDGHPLPFS